MKTVIKAGKVVNSDRVQTDHFIVIEDGKIVDVVKDYSLPDDQVRFIDASGLEVYPGAIDPHTHLNDPGETISEDLYTGTASAAAGGITTVLDMPVTIPLVDNREAFLRKKEIGESKAVVDFGLWCAATPDNMDELETLADLGAAGFKSYLSYSRFCRSLNLGQMWEIMNRIKRIGAVMGLHAEMQDVVDACEKPYRAANSGRFSDFARGRAPIAEKVAVKSAVELAKDTGVKLHIVHATVADVIDTVYEAKRQGYPVSVETCPHYLTMNLEDLDRKEIGPFGICIPPLREQKEVDGLWERIEGGKIDFVGSDHATYTFEEKATTDIWNTYFGITSIQTMIPLLYDGMMKRGMSCQEFAALVSHNAAKRYGLAQKGYIGKGYDADLFFLDPKGSWKIKAEDLFYKMKWTTYEGMRLKGRVTATMVRGEMVYENGKIVREPGYGKFLKPVRDR